VIALLLDLSNIVGGFLLAIALLGLLPRVGDDLRRADGVIEPFGWIVGIVALVTGGYYLLVHATSGPHIFHFEVVAIGVGVALLWGRLTGTASGGSAGVLGTPAPASAQASARGGLEGAALLLAIFGVIAIIVGIQGLFTPN
jgi:hypothetical protein